MARKAAEGAGDSGFISSKRYIEEIFRVALLPRPTALRCWESRARYQINLHPLPVDSPRPHVLRPRIHRRGVSSRACAVNRGGISIGWGGIRAISGEPAEPPLAC